MNLPRRIFGQADQEWFARMSADTNPLHMDKEFAARTYPGAQVVHGVHALLWALEVCCAADALLPIKGIRASFVKPILVGDEVVVEASGGAIRLLVHGETMIAAALSHLDSPDEFSASQMMIWRVGSAPTDWTRKDLTTCCGQIESPQTTKELRRAFPGLARAANPDFAHGLCTISTLVGMACPGLHGILAELSVGAETTARTTLEFAVLKYDRRFNRVSMATKAPGLRGTVAAFARAPQSPPIPDSAVRDMIPSKSFAGQSPLIIGGTSGLGIATARLLAAGGARPILGYRSCTLVQEAVDAVRPLGGCDTVSFDVNTPAAGVAALTEMKWLGSEVYYFASPRIFRRRIEPYQAGDLRDFLNIFVDAFYETVQRLVDYRNGKPLTVFYPSTAALDEHTSDLFEYRLAKLGGEELCQRLTENYGHVQITCARLPRIATRQTHSFIKTPADAPERAMAPFVLELQALARRVLASP